MITFPDFFLNSILSDNFIEFDTFPDIFSILTASPDNFLEFNNFTRHLLRSIQIFSRHFFSFGGFTQFFNNFFPHFFNFNGLCLQFRPIFLNLKIFPTFFEFQWFLPLIFLELTIFQAAFLILSNFPAFYLFSFFMTNTNYSYFDRH